MLVGVSSLWAAPTPSAPVVGVVTVPGSKSLTNRLLVLAALADSPTDLVAPLRSRDTLLMAQALRALGCTVADVGDDWRVTPGSSTGPVTLDCGNAGTVARFAPPLAALRAGTTVVDGDPRMRERPIGPLLAALRQLGARVDGDTMPFTLTGGSLRGGEVTIDASRSSQLVSGLLLSGPGMPDGVVVRHVGEPVPSAPHLVMTVEVLRAAGAVVDDSEPDVWRVLPGRLRGGVRVVEPDLSSASAFLAAAAATGGSVTMRGWPTASTQPGVLLPGLLERMGCTTSVLDGNLTVSRTGELVGLDVDLHSYGEVVPTMAALAVLASTPSRFRGVDHLRTQETDRLAALAGELGKLGADVTVTSDGLAIRPAPLTGARLDPQADHRLAMAYAVVGLRVPGVLVDDMATVGKTVPEFPAMWAALTGASS